MAPQRPSTSTANAAQAESDSDSDWTRVVQPKAHTLKSGTGTARMMRCVKQAQLFKTHSIFRCFNVLLPPSACIPVRKYDHLAAATMLALSAN